jgi:hypothetical protein
MSTFKRFLSLFILSSFLFASSVYAAGVLEKTGTAGAVIQGAKLGKNGLNALTKYGQRLVTDDNKTEEELEQQIKQYSQQQTTQTNQNLNQQTKQNNNKGILDNIASSVSDSADELKTIIDKKTEPLQNTVIGVGQLFSKVKDKVSGSDNVQEQSETISSSDNKNNNNSNDDEEGNTTVHFGQVENQVYHTFRHIDEMGLDRNIVQKAIKTDLAKVSNQIQTETTLSRTIEVNGQKLQYNLYKFKNGEINIGRINAIKD